MTDPSLKSLYEEWSDFLIKNVKEPSAVQIIFDQVNPLVIDSAGRKMRINFNEDKANYNKFKKSISSEPLSRALGAGKKGLSVLDLSAGLGVDALFLTQLGYHVVAVERNPIVYMCLQLAWRQLSSAEQKKIQFVYSSAQDFLKTSFQNIDVVYFDPMFPTKAKSALPKQEMLLFKDLVGADEDATDVLKAALALQKFKRIVVKRPVSAPVLLKPQGEIEGKMIRYDIYGS